MTDCVRADTLSGLAPLLRVRPQLDDVCRVDNAWAAVHEAAPAGHAYFHIVTHGSAVLDQNGSPPVHLNAGDILLLPHGSAHRIHGSGASSRASPPVAIRQHEALRIRTSLDAEPDVELICGRLRFEAASRSLVLAALPNVVLLHVGEQPLIDRFQPLLAAIRDELSEERAGALAVAENLASAMFVMMLRGHLEASAPTEGLLRLLAQPTTAHAVSAMLHDPAHAWTLDELAHAAAASRATLVRAFRRTAGVTPLEFLTDLRLGLARHRLHTETTSLDRIAADAGYQSQGAFSRAFLRRYGIRPGQARQDAHASAAT